jgi:hypothetical protein
MHPRGAVGDLRIDPLQPELPAAKGEASLEAIFGLIDTDPQAAARGILALVDSPAAAEALMHTARRLIFLKGDDSHDYKFSSAVLEDFYHTGSAWRSRYLAASAFHLRGSSARDNPLVERTRAALRASQG